MESSVTPSPSSTSAFSGSPAISPHIETRHLAARAASQICFSSRSTARCSGRYR